MKLSNVLHYTSTFALAFLGVITVASVLSLIEQSFLRTDTVQAHEVRSVLQVDLRNGYVGDFSRAPEMPSIAREESRLPIIPTVAPPAASAVPTATEANAEIDDSPWVTIGLFEPNADDQRQTVILAADSESDILLEDGTGVRGVKAGKKVKVRYYPDTGHYTVKRGGWSTKVSQPVWLVPRSSHSVVTIHSYENRPNWDTSLNDNEFLGQVAVSGNWVIMKAHMENYLKGIAEASNDNDPAYLKALVTAARSYTYYHYLHPTKYPDDPFLLTATPNDQVFRGYGYTKRSPNWVSAVDATRGKTLHLNGEPVVTPYFSQTDGRTRSAEEVWGVEYWPHLQSVEDPGSAGGELLGHGVGMSALGARYFAEEEDWGWKKILKYYYQDISLKQVWK